MKGSGYEGDFLPLGVFAAATSIESFLFSRKTSYNLSSQEKYSPAWTFGCLRGLSGLQHLELKTDLTVDNIPRCADLLGGLPSNHLTRLALPINAVPLELMRQIARFRDLQELELWSSDANTTFLDQLPDLKCLTSLVLHVGNGEWRDPEVVSAIKARLERLRTAIRERARLVGVDAQVTMRGLDDPVGFRVI